MRIVVDGEIFQLQRVGGISALEREILPLMCDAAPDLQVDLVTTGRARATLPQHAQIRHLPLLPVDDLLRPRRIWAPLAARLRGLLQARALGSGDAAVWHATFYAPPPPGWRGRSVVTVYDLIHEQFPQLFRGAYNRRLRADKRRSLLSADRIISISVATAACLRDYIPVDAARVRVVPCALDAAFLGTDDGAALSVQPPQPYLLYVGQRGGHKNFELLARAYARWPRRDHIALLVVGPRWTRREARSLPHAVQRHLVSGVSHDDLRRLYARAAAVVLPSLAEGFGIPVLEALACAVPLVASDIPSTRELAAELPYYFQPTDADDLQRALDAALDDPTAAQRRRAGRAIAARYSWQRSAAETLAVYRELSA